MLKCENLIDNIAFLLRNQYGPDITANQLSVVYDEHINTSLSTGPSWCEIAAILHKGPGPLEMELAFFKRYLGAGNLARPLADDVEAMAHAIFRNRFREF